MATEVKHGPNPTFQHQVTGSGYGLTIVSRYTTTPDVAAGGVTTYTYESTRDEKRRAELLNMRTIFLHWCSPSGSRAAATCGRVRRSWRAARRTRSRRSCQVGPSADPAASPPPASRSARVVDAEAMIGRTTLVRGKRWQSSPVHYYFPKQATRKASTNALSRSRSKSMLAAGCLR